MEKHMTTRNGVDVFSFPNPHMHQIYLGVYLRYGSMYEPQSYNGIAHFFEHILFRNINKLYGGAFYRLLGENYIDFNASTYKEMIVLQICFPICKTDFVLEFFEKIFSPIVLSAQEISVERDRIRSEIRESKEFAYMRQLADRTIWADTPLANPIVGTYSSIAKIHKKQLETVRQAIFSQQNMFVYLTGAVPAILPQKLCTVLERQNFSETIPVRGNMAPIPRNFQNRNCTVITREDCFSAMMLCFDMDCTKVIKAERDLLYNVLFSGDFCKFYQSLSEGQGLIYSHDAILEEYRNIGNMRVFLDYAEADFLLMMREIVDVLRSVKQGDFDLECAKSMYTIGTNLLLDNVSDLNRSLAYESKFLGVPYSLEESAGIYASITKERISEIAADIFTTDNLVLVVKGNIGEKKIKAAREILAELDQ